MELRLYERRTETKLIDGWMLCENNCPFCHAKQSVNQLEPLRPNIHKQLDYRGNIMMEQHVCCNQCGANWIDVFCRIYPPTIISD